MKNLIFIGVTPYPNGQASTNRLVSLFSELALRSWNIRVLCLSSTKYPTTIVQDIPKYERIGFKRDVQFRYLSLSVKASRYLVFRNISCLFGWFVLPFHLLKTTYKDEAIVITNLTQVRYTIYLKAICLAINKKLILIRSEYPRIIQKKNFKAGIFKSVFEKWIFKLFNGFVLMTYTLEEYFNRVKHKKSPVKLIPMTVELSRFRNSTASPFPFEYIVYAGSLSHEKDGIDILVKAFASLAKNHKEIHLVIVGDNSNQKQFEKTMNIINQFPRHISERIVFTGKVDSSKVPQYLMNAKIMALARPDSIQARGGFPTKLGEYLATGKPVVVTSVGEIPLYLRHLRTAFLCKPGDISDFAQNLDRALTNYPAAAEIGLQGKKLAEEVFNAEVQSEALAEFLKGI